MIGGKAESVSAFPFVSLWRRYFLSFSAKKMGCIMWELYYNIYVALTVNRNKRKTERNVLGMNAREYLERIPLWADKKNGLDSIRDFLKEMGNPDESMRIIHVAGTNGKGSVCQYLTSVLRGAGFRVGTFVSPHLEDIRERFLICGEPAGEDRFERAFAQVRQLAENMTGRGYAPPSYFEFLFYMFMDMMREYEPDFVVLETGLGGRLDTTNAVRNPVLTVLTSISMDHMQYLGDTIEKIAAEKAGILREHVTAVYDGSCPESRKIIEKKAESLGCRQVLVNQDDYTFAGRDEEKTVIEVGTGNWGKLRVEIPSQAEYQMMNTALAVRALDVLAEEMCGGEESSCRQTHRGMAEESCRPERREISKGREIPKGGGMPENNRQQEFCSLMKIWKTDGGERILQGIRGSCWPGRMEQVLRGVYLDGAHNAGGVEALNRTIRRMQKETGKQVSIMFGAVSDKDHHQMIGKLCDGLDISQVTIAHMDTRRSARPEELEEEFKQVVSCPVKVFPAVGQAWEYFLKTRGDSLAFCAGSLYLVGEVKGLLHGR